MAAPPEVMDLVVRFLRNKDSYTNPHYNETQTRREFIDPFFRTLGWDVDNRQGLAEAYKDVVHEESILVGTGSKAPDYSFRIGGTRKFFVEAKRPSISLAKDPAPAYQLRRYAWSAKLPLSILFSFRELVVYDCTREPAITDRPSVARVMYLIAEEYDDRWHEIDEIFSKDAVLKGSFDRYADSTRAKRGTAHVDSAFLNEIESWREGIAKNLALRNTINQRELNFAVQQTVDRIVFLRICEDRGIEPYGQLQGLLDKRDVYQHLTDIYKIADERYNSGLFHFRREPNRAEEPDTLTLGLTLDDKPLKQILQRLYYPESPYEFSVLPADILGHVYEQFLGKVIRLTPTRRVQVEEKPEVKKAGGVVYTPTFIVDYIVNETISVLLDALSVDDLGGSQSRRKSPLRILDPACGSGSFLIGAYQRLLDWYRDHYAEDPHRWSRTRPPKVFQSAGGEWKLTTTERKRILLAHIFGVDIDPQAVEVTKLSLLLKVLEGESSESLQQQFRFFHERALPDLDRNIKCGNSLIENDFYEGQISLAGEEERYRINAFDWETEFAEAFDDSGGFQVVIGNPPYVLLQDEFRDDAQLEYFRSQYKVAAYKIDTYHLFIERAIALGAKDGRVSMITPANFLTNNYLVGLRELLLDESALKRIAVIDGGVFEGRSVDNAIFVAEPGQRSEEPIPLLHLWPLWGRIKVRARAEINPTSAREDQRHLLTGSGGGGLGAVWERTRSVSTQLGSIAWVNFGKQLRDRRKYKRDVIQVEALNKIPTKYRACYTGRDVNRYHVEWNDLACLDTEEARRGGCWDPDRQNAVPKLLTRQIGRHPTYGIDEEGLQCLNSLFMVSARDPDGMDLWCLLAILNSTLLKAYWLDHFYDRRRTFPKIKGTYLKELPIVSGKPEDTAFERSCETLADQARSIVEVYERAASARTAHEKTLAQRQIPGLERDIDRLVYSLYRLTDQERDAVESFVSGAIEEEDFYGDTAVAED